MLNSYNPYNVISLDMSSKDKANDKAYAGTRIFPVSFYITTDNGNVVPYAYDDSLDIPLYHLLTESRNYDYSEAQLENAARTGSFLVVPWLLTYFSSSLTSGIETPPELIIELQNIEQYIVDNSLILNQNIGDQNKNGNKTGMVIGIASDGTLHLLALDLQSNSGDSSFE